jgi:hypothetical protein
MPYDASKKAKHFRQQADRARRLAEVTSAPDVADGLRRYASKLDKEAGELDEQVLAAALGQQSTPAIPQRRAKQATKGDQARRPTRPK